MKFCFWRQLFWIILFCTYKPKTILTVLFARKVFRSTLQKEFTLFLTGSLISNNSLKFSKKIHEKQSNIPEKTLEKKVKLILEQTVLHKSLQLILDRIHTLLYIYFYLFCVKIQFKPSRRIRILLRNKLSNMRLKR